MSTLTFNPLYLHENNIMSFDEQLRFHIKYRHDDEAIEMLSKVKVDYESLLHYAIECDNNEIVWELILQGAKINCFGPDGNTPLMTAVKAERTQIVRTLLGFNVDLHLSNASGMSALQMAYDPRLVDSEILEVIQSKVKLDTCNVDELVDKLVEAGCAPYHAAYLNDVEVLRCMFSRGIDVDSRDVAQRTALHGAVDLDKMVLIEWLVRRGADVNALDEEETSPLMMAVGNGSHVTTRFLLERGADPNRGDTLFECTPLFLAVKDSVEHKCVPGYGECVEVLVEYGAIPRNSIHYSNTIFDFALNSKIAGIVDLLVGHLAMLERLGTRDVETVIQCNEVEHIEDIYRIRSDYETCQRMLDTVVFEGRKLLDLLVESETKMKLLTRNETFVPMVEHFCSEQKLKESCMYYYKKLWKSVSRAKKLLELENTAISAVCDLFGGSYNQGYIAARYVVDYLGESDLVELSQI